MNFFIIIFILFLSTFSYSSYASSLKDIRSQVNSYVSSLASPFKANKAQKVVEQQYAVKNPGTLFVDATKGSITIKSAWDKEIVYMKATIKAQKEEDLEKISIDPIHSHHKKTDLTIAASVSKNDKKISHHIDYELIIPQTMKLSCSTVKGPISIIESHQAICAKTGSGSISITNSHGPVDAISYKGNINISNALGTINAQSDWGNISVEHANNTVIAHTKKGTVKTSHGSIAPTNAISLTSEMGSVTIALPSSTPAHLRSKTAHGTIFSAVPVTLKSCTTKIDNDSWKKFRRDIEGTLGDRSNPYERMAKIELNTGTGNIRILDNSIMT